MVDKCSQSMPLSYSRAKQEFNHLIPRQGWAKYKEIDLTDECQIRKKSPGRDLIPFIDFLLPDFADSAIRAETERNFKDSKNKIAVCWQTCFPCWSNMVTKGEDTVTDTIHQNNQMRTPNMILNCMFWPNKLSGNLRQPVSGTNITSPNIPSFSVGWSEPNYFIITKMCRGAVGLNHLSNSNQHRDGIVCNFQITKAAIFFFF